MAVTWDIARGDDSGVLGVHDEPFHPLGTIYQDMETGFVWQYVKAEEELTFGQAVKPSYNLLRTTAGQVAAAAAGTREINVVQGLNLLTSLARVNPRNSRQKEYAMLDVVGGTGAGQQGIIHEIQRNRLIVEWDGFVNNKPNGNLLTALDNTSLIEIYALWLGQKTTDADDPTIGFVQQRDGVPLGKYFWILYCGTGKFLSGAAIARGGALMAGATDGTLIPATAAALNRVGISNVTVAGSAGQFSGTLKANILIGEVPTRIDIGYNPSTQPPPAS